VLPVSVFALADRISGITVEGLRNVKPRKVWDVISLKKNKIYSEEKVRDDVRSILSLGSFEIVDSNYDEKNGLLTYTVTEKPCLEKIVFKGNNAFKENKLKNELGKDEIGLKGKSFYDVIKLENAKRKIISLYAEKGYADMLLEVYPVIDTDTNKINLTFFITENNRVILGGVHVDGVLAFSEKKILNTLKTKKKKIFNSEIFQLDLKTIETFYKDKGFFDYKVIESTTDYNPERTEMFLTVAIQEGQRYCFGDIALDVEGSDGVLSIDGIDRKKIFKHIKIKKGDIYNQSAIIQSIQEIYELYSDKGYMHVDINPDFKKEEEKGVIDVVVKIKENSVVFLGNVYIEGLTSTKEKVIIRELLLKSGDVFSSSKIRRSIERIYNLGFIDGVEPNVLPTNNPSVMELSLLIAEGRPGMITAGAGYSSVDQFIGSIQLQHMNLFGLAQRLNLLWEFGERRQNYEIGWTDPWILNKNASLSLSVYDIQRLRDYGSWTDAYEENRIGFSAQVGPRISERIGLLFGYSYEYVDMYDYTNDTVKQLIHNATDISQDKSSSLSAQIAYDSRDYIFDPSSGSRHSLALVCADSYLGGNVDYLKANVKTTWFFPTFWKFVLSVNIAGGLVTNYGVSEKVPLYEKYYIGGADTVRGYKYRTEIGAEDGGKIMAVMNIEYKFPIVSERGRTVLQGAIFYDIGGIWDKFNDVDFTIGKKQTNLHSGVGFGIRFATPVFPLRLDWGYGLDHKEGEQLQQFYFTIGNIF
jgi:outer membrane protein insertion porin family